MCIRDRSCAHGRVVPDRAQIAHGVGRDRRRRVATPAEDPGPHRGRRGNAGGGALGARGRAAGYLRASLDATGEGLAVDRQRKECQAILDARGWHLSGEYVDNSISASDAKKNRPAYTRLVADFEAGAFDALVCYDLDRLTRQPRQLEDWIDAAEDRGLLLTTANGEADLSTDNGRLFARIKASVARGEVERKSARQREANDQSAEKGKPHAGRRVFGYSKNGMKIQTKESVEFVKAVAAVLDGGRAPPRGDGRMRPGGCAGRGATAGSTGARRPPNVCGAEASGSLTPVPSTRCCG